jgi:hypothetical protein
MAGMTILSGPSVGLPRAHVGLEVHAIRVSSALGDVAGIRAGGELLSVHHRAINLWLGGRLIAVVGGAAATSTADGPAAQVARGPISCPPFGLVIAEGVDLASLGLRAGMPCGLGDGWLRIGDRLSVRVQGARQWSPYLHAVAQLPGDPAAVAERARLARTVAAGEGPGGLAAGGEWEAEARAPLHRLSAALAGGDLRAAEASGAELIGLGAGLTPSGDDLLVGVSAALTALGDPAGGELARSWATTAAGRTTPVALAFHRYAAQAAYDELVHALLGAVLLGTPAALKLAVRQTAAWGATSGRDLLAGMVLGLEAAAARAGHGG